MFLTILAERIVTVVFQHFIHRLAECSLMHGQRVAANLFQANTADGTVDSTEIAVEQLLAQTDGFEQFRTPIATDGADTHLTQYLI